MTELKIDLKGVIQVKDGPGWEDKKKGEPFKPKVVFQPIMDAITAIRSVDSSIYIGLIYGANAGQSKLMFDLYGFSNANPPSTGKTTVDIAKKIDTLTSEMILTFSGSGQAAVLSNAEVQEMLQDIKKFIIIPFDTVDSKPKLDETGVVIAGGTGDYTSYGHKDDCLAFAKKFLDIDKANGGSIIIGWQPMVSECTIPIDTDAEGLKSINQGSAVKLEFAKLYFALGAGVAGDLEPTAKKYIDFLIQNWNSESQKTINSLLKPVLLKKDDVKPPAAPAAPAAAAATPSVTNEQIMELRTGLETARSKADKSGAFTIAEDIFNAFFSGSAVKTNQTKEFLTDQVAKLTAMPIFTDDKHKLLDSISTRLASITDAAATVKSGEVKKPVGPATTIKYVFAFDIDDTLVENGVLVRTKGPSGRSIPFDPSTHATDHTEMLNLMKAIIDAEHHVWIVTANTNIAKDTFDTDYLKGRKEIIGKYYFMNPTTVVDDLNTQFDNSKISPYLTESTTLDLSFKTTDGGSDFQRKGLKPYAMIAKWLQLGNPDMNNVKMYLFDDSVSYGTNCTNVKDNKIEFVKIGPPAAAPAPSSPPPPPPGFKSDVLTEATKKFVAIPTTKAPVTSGGRKLKVMTFNTWYEAFSPTDYTLYCNSKGTNMCTDTIMKTIVDRMKDGGPQVIFLQEFTSRFDEFFGKVEGVVINPTHEFKSKSKVKTKNPADPDGRKIDTGIPHLRHFTMTAGGNKFYVYTATIAGETITTIYSSELCNKSADTFFIGNTATVRRNPRPTDNAPYFWNRADNNYNNADEESWIFGGARPYIVLEFKDMNLVLINLHSHRDEPFRPPDSTEFAEDQLNFISGFEQENGSVNSVQTYAFTVLGNMLRDSTRIPKLDDYNIIIGGDFNAEPERTLKLLNLSLGNTAKFTDGGITRKTAGNTCCTTNDGDNFVKAVDQIYSRGLEIIKDTYTVHNVSTLEKGTGKETQKYFSDHLPVYAEIILPASSSS